ncbi:LysR family transcriptional regulator [Bosea sp. TWI1241]|uniref:LysR family transcriptional regulator n=1 Tax=Bosea sp. TWI1241 TaxID=3148904 RepID=UPI003209219A
MKLNFRQTEILWAIVMAGSSSGAARLLNVSQPAVSKMLSQIEAQLGVSLFERVRGKLQPTDQVRLLFEEISKAQKVMRRVNDVADSLSKQGGGALTLASIPSLAQAILPKTIARFHQEHPEIVVRLDTGAVPELIEAVLQGEAELGLLVMLTDHPFLTVLPLLEGRLLAAIPRTHPLAAKTSVALADLSPHPHILVGSRMPFGMLASSAFEQAGLPCRVCADVPNSQQACALVNAGVGIALVDEFTTSNMFWPDVVTRPLKERIGLRTSIVYSRDRPPSPLARHFIDLLRS